MVYQYAPRLSRHYSDISGVLQVWTDNTTRSIVVEHEADENVRKTHLHLGLWGLDIQEEALKRKLNSQLTVKLSGNKDWSWVHKRFPDGIPEFIDDFVVPSNAKEQGIFKYLKYCIKGDLSRVKFVKNISPDLLKAAAEAWVEEVNPDKSPDVIIVEHKRIQSPPYQQLVIADAAERWFAYKRECKERNELPDKHNIVKFVCDAMRSQSKGINPYMVKELTWAVLYDDLDFRDILLKKLISFVFV